MLKLHVFIMTGDKLMEILFVVNWFGRKEPTLISIEEEVEDLVEAVDSVEEEEVGVDLEEERDILVHEVALDLDLDLLAILVPEVDLLLQRREIILVLHDHVIPKK